MMAKILAVVALAVVASGVTLWLLVAFEKPLPVELFSAEAAYDLDDYDGSAPPGARAPLALMLGTPLRAGRLRIRRVKVRSGQRRARCLRAQPGGRGPPATGLAFRPARGLAP